MNLIESLLKVLELSISHTNAGGHFDKKKDSL